MHLVFLNQYYPPDAAPTGVMLEAVVNELAAQGHQVTVICAHGGYAEISDKKPREDQESNIERRCEDQQSPPNVIEIRATRFGRETFAGKLLDCFSYYLGVVWHLAVMLPKPDRMVALTSPPYLSLLARAMSRLRGADHAHWVMDLYPNVMVAHGMLRESGVMHRFLARLARWGMGGKRCAAVLTIGPDMAVRLDELLSSGKITDHGASTHHRLVSWVPLWSKQDQEMDDTTVANRRKAMGWSDHELVIMYSGNMGLGHRFDEILEAIGRISKNNPADLTKTRFVFFGGGKRRSEIAEFIGKHPDAPLELHDYVPAVILATHLRSADLHLVSLDEKWTGTMLPSKLQGIFTAGRPVIFIGDAESSIGRWVDQSSGGWIVGAGNADELYHAILQASDTAERIDRGRSAKAFANANFDRQTNVRKVVNILVY